ncbi:hypothetical protein B0H16DRAFT_1733310 [Mycena metata]|uniref:F-box domain-containing protein n=1 Tax=Mycena metata TaxID=1033252 RepID=A0AAD7MTH0_9AGAR|nr:hypothetical protein B0H16DRAFT_1733310 [Mycena metata]
MLPTVPDDIVREIFIHTLPTLKSIAASHFPRPYFAKPSATTSPLLLCFVCVRWRRIAITQSRLWASLDPSCIANGQLVQHWLERSGNSIPLSFSLRPPPGGSKPHHLRILWSQIGRCRNLEISGVSLPIGVMPLSKLETLSVSLHADAPEAADWFSAALSHCTLLTRLHWDGPSIFAPWPQLTYLSLHPRSPEHLFDTLQHLANLVELHLCCPADTASFDQSPFNPCVLPNVTTFGVQSHEGLFTFVTLPALQHLVLVDCWDGVHLEDLLERSACHIESLEMQIPSDGRIHGCFDHAAIAPSLRRSQPPHTI